MNITRGNTQNTYKQKIATNLLPICYQGRNWIMEETEDQVVNYISKRKFLTLATSSSNGKPYTHPLAYVNIRATTYFSTSKESRKIKNIN